MKLLLALAVLILLLASVFLLLPRRPDDPVTAVLADDPEMLAAIAEARRSLPLFFERLRRPPPTQTYAGVKVRLVEGDEVEHVWLYDVTLRDGHFSGRIANEVQGLREWQAHDSLRVPTDSVTDWMLIDDGELVGGYSIRLFRARMTEAERAEADRTSPFRIADSQP
jgi:uncharacterized protein YegJ (DUF2314 family)